MYFLCLPHNPQSTLPIPSTFPLLGHILYGEIITKKERENNRGNDLLILFVDVKYMTSHNLNWTPIHLSICKILSLTYLKLVHAPTKVADIGMYPP